MQGQSEATLHDQKVPYAFHMQIDIDRQIETRQYFCNYLSLQFQLLLVKIRITIFAINCSKFLGMFDHKIMKVVFISRNSYFSDYNYTYKLKHQLHFTQKAVMITITITRRLNGPQSLTVYTIDSSINSHMKTPI